MQATAQKEIRVIEKFQRTLHNGMTVNIETEYILDKENNVIVEFFLKERDNELLITLSCELEEVPYNIDMGIEFINDDIDEYLNNPDYNGR